MADYTNTGKAWVNDYKKEGDKQPSFKGKGNYQGTNFDVGLWENEDGSFYLRFSEPYVKPEGGTWEQQREKFAVKKDNLPTNEEVDEPIDLSSIPF